MKQYGFYINVAKCTGCKTCMVACKDKNNLPVGMNFRRVAEYSGGSWRQDRMTGAWREDVFAYYLSISCNHCEDPACVKACPTKAHYKRSEDGLVLINQDKCVGCGMCAKACPYGAPQLDVSAKKMRKCDACIDRLEKGFEPTCVAACPQRAIAFGEIEQLRRQYGQCARIAPLVPSSLTKPCLVITPSKNAKRAGDTSGVIHNPLK